MGMTRGLNSTPRVFLLAVRGVTSKRSFLRVHDLTFQRSLVALILCNISHALTIALPPHPLLRIHQKYLADRRPLELNSTNQRVINTHMPNKRGYVQVQAQVQVQIQVSTRLVSNLNYTYRTASRV